MLVVYQTKGRTKYITKTSLLQERPFNCFTNNWDTSFSNVFFSFSFFSSNICLTRPHPLSVEVINTKYGSLIDLIMNFYQMNFCRISSSPLEVISLLLIFFNMAPLKCFKRYHDLIWTKVRSHHDVLPYEAAKDFIIPYESYVPLKQFLSFTFFSKSIQDRIDLKTATCTRPNGNDNKHIQSFCC